MSSYVFPPETYLDCVHFKDTKYGTVENIKITKCQYMTTI